MAKKKKKREIENANKELKDMVKALNELPIDVLIQLKNNLEEIDEYNKNHPEEKDEIDKEWDEFEKKKKN